MFRKEIIEEDAIDHISQLKYHVLSPQLRVEDFYSLKVTQLELADDISTSSFTEDETKIFSVIQGGTRLYDYPDDLQLAISIELNLNMLIIRRRVYGILDLLGDIGGLAGSLYSLFFALILIFQYK